jgi:transcriptional regulator with XRE-family HTH domain
VHAREICCGAQENNCRNAAALQKPPNSLKIVQVGPHGTPLAQYLSEYPEMRLYLSRPYLEQVMADDTDLHVGKRLRRRRRLLGLTQQDLASQVGVRFQQIQKYECGANRITSSRLFELSKALNVSVQYFFDGIPTTDAPDPANDAERLEGDILSQKETLELVRAYYRLGERPRKRLLELAKALEGDASNSGAA